MATTEKQKKQAAPKRANPGRTLQGEGIALDAVQEALREENRALRAECNQLRDAMAALRQEFGERLAGLEETLPHTVEPSKVLPAETLVIIAAAVTAFLGKKVRVQSARLVSAPSSWAQAGRAIVQASHNLVRPGYQDR